MIGMKNNNKTLTDLFEVVKAIKVEFGGRFDNIDKKFDAIDKRSDSLKSELTEKMDEGFRHQGVLMEVMQDDIDTLVDGQEALHERIDGLQTTVSSIESKVEQLDMRLINVEVV